MLKLSYSHTTTLCIALSVFLQTISPPDAKPSTRPSAKPSAGAAAKESKPASRNPQSTAAPVFSVITQEDRVFFEKVLKRKGTDEEVLLLAAMADEKEGNYAVLKRFKELQSRYARHQREKVPPEAESWVFAKLAYYEFLHGSKKEADNYCNIAMKNLKAMPDPIDLDGGFFFVEANEALAKTLGGLKRTADYNRTQTLLGHAKLRFGRRATEKLMVAAFEFYLAGDRESARGLCAEAIRGEPGYAGSYFLRAFLNFKDKNYNSSFKDLERVSAICPDWARVRVLKALCLYFLDKKDRALAELDSAVEAAHQPEAYMVRAAIKMENDPQSAESDLLEAMKSPHADWRIFSMYADYKFETKNFAEAAKSYSRALELMDSTAKPVDKGRDYYRRGLCYRALKDASRATSDFNAAISFDPKRGEQVKKLLARIDEGPSTAASAANNTKPPAGDKVVASGKQEGSAAAENPASAKENKPAENPEVTPETSEKIDEELASAKLGDSCKQYVAEVEVAEPTYRKGQYVGPAIKPVPSIAKSTVVATEQKKNSWLLDDSSPVTKPDDKNPSAAKSTAALAESHAPAQDAGAGKPAVAETRDPYLRYLERKINQSIETAPSSNISVTFRIQEDGAPAVQPGNDGNTTVSQLSNVLTRSAPFKVPSAETKNNFRADIDAGTRAVRIKFAD